jgi:tetratricopeptide repeat protein
MRDVALELEAHGFPGGRNVLERTLEWLRDRPVAEQATEFDRLELAKTYFAAEQWDSARAITERLAREHPDNPDYRGLIGALGARLGDRATAERADLWLAGLQGPFLRGAPSHWRACIAAGLGDRDRAVALLQQAHADGFPFTTGDLASRGYAGSIYVGLHADPCFALLRGYAPFQDLLRPRG